MLLRGKCKHKGCRAYQLIHFRRKDYGPLIHSPAFLVRYDKTEKSHVQMLCRQTRGVLRNELKEALKHSKAKTYNNENLRNIDEEMYKNNITNILSDGTIRKARSEMLKSNDICIGDFEDFISLQKATEDDPYIKKVGSPFAVYMHSSLQYKVLEAAHVRKNEGEEIVGRVDATGGVVKVHSTTSNAPILYYPLTMELKGDPNDDTNTIYPVTESINSGHGVPDISAWLNDFMESFTQYNSKINPLFDRIVSDFAYANFHGVRHSFHSMRIQEYLFISYKYATQLNDYSKLRTLTKIQMCCVHLSKTFTLFVKKYFPSSNFERKKTSSNALLP